jgi:hypothetical protein
MKKFTLTKLDNRHKGKAYFKYRLEFKTVYRQSETAVERFAAMQIWFTQQFGIGYDYGTWMSLAQLKSKQLNPYWCFENVDGDRYIYMWNDEMLSIFNLYHGGDNG